MSGRDSRGRFPQGTSGNRRGRPLKQTKRYETLEDFDRVLIDTANRPVGKTSDGKEGPALFQYAALNLATGNTENRLAARHFILMVQEAAMRQDRRTFCREEEELRAARLAALKSGGWQGLAEYDAQHL